MTMRHKRGGGGDGYVLNSHRYEKLTQRNVHSSLNRQWLFIDVLQYSALSMLIHHLSGRLVKTAKLHLQG